MKKIFTLFAAGLVSLAMFAADFTPTAVYTVGDESTLGPQWKSAKQTANFFESGDTVIFSPYILYQSAATGWQEWTGCAGSGSTGTEWDAMSCFKGSSTWFSSDAKAATTRTSRKYLYNVTNCSDVLIYVKTGGSNRTLYLCAYEINAGEVATDTAAYVTYTENTNGVATLAGLDRTKTYRITVDMNVDSNAPFYEIAFVGQASAEPKLEVSPAEITLDVTAAVANPSASVTFSGKNLAAGSYALSVPDLAGLTVNPTSVTVGEDGKLNAQVTISYTSAVEVAAASTSVDLTIGSLTKVVTVNYSAVLTKQYISSINIEQLVLDNGTGYDIRSALTAADIEYANIDALDTLNDLENKANRNYPFLGLKLKKADAKLAGWLQAGHTIKVRFGNVGANFLVRAAGMDSVCTAANFANATVESNNELSFTAPIDMYLEIICNSTKTLVIKQIMVDADIAPVVLPEPNAYLITIPEFEHGTVTANWANKKYRTPVGALVTLTVTPEEGYVCTSLTWNGTPLHDEVEGEPITFTMPAEEVTIAATFDTSFPTSIKNVEMSEKAVKFIENGQLIIMKNGVKYNAQGAELR